MYEFQKDFCRIFSGTVLPVIQLSVSAADFVGEKATPEYIETEGDVYDYMYEYTVGGTEGDVWYEDYLPAIDLEEDYMYDIMVKEYAVSGSSETRGLYYLMYDGAGWDVAQYQASKSFMIWESEDLVHWSEQREYPIGEEITLENGEKPFNVGCVWAPEGIWDEEKQQYMVFWASMVCEEKPAGYDSLSDEADKYELMKKNSKQRIYRSYTSDFKTFTKPELYIERDNHIIDTTILDQDGLYYRYSKDETTKNVGCEYSTSLDGPWIATELGIEKCEGPTAFKFNHENKWGLYVDSLAGSSSGYGLYSADNMCNGNDGYVWTSINSPSIIGNSSGLRHGTIIPITLEEYDRLTEAFSSGSDDEEPSETDDYTYSFAEDVTASAGAVNTGDVVEWKITSSPEYFYIAQADLEKLEKITLRAGHGGKSYGCTYKLYAYDSDGKALTKEELEQFKTDSSPLGTEIAKAADTNDAWGYSTIVIDKSGVTLDNNGGNYRLDTENSSGLSVDGMTGSWDYNVRYGVSDSPLGPIEGNTMILSRHNTDSPLIRGNAHHSVINIPETDEWYICYHRFNVPLYGDFEGQAAEPGNHREVCIDKLEFDENGNIKTVTATLDGITEPVYVPQGSVSISLSGNTVTAEYNVQYSDEGDSFKAYLAIYGENGVLERIVENEVTDGKSELSASADGASSMKAFLWKNNQTPVCKAAVDSVVSINE